MTLCTDWTNKAEMTNKENKLPNSKSCFVCGLYNEDGLKMTFYSIDENTIEAFMTVPEKFAGYPGIAHGGIVASMLDEMITHVFLTEDSGRMMFTGKLSIRYRKNTPTEQPLRLVSTKTKDRGRVGEALAKLYGPDGDLLAEAEGMAIAVPEEQLDYERLEDLGWKVYPD